MKKFKEEILSLNLNPTTEYIKIGIIEVLILLVGIITYFLTKYLIAIIISVSLVPIAFVAFIYRYQIYKEDKRKRLASEFLEVFSYIRIYLVNKENVYTAIRKAGEYSSKEMSKEINEFLQEVDKDKSIVPFLDFGKKFQSKAIEEVMISLYQMIDGGFTESYLNQFVNIFENLRNRINNEVMTKRYKNIDSLNQMSLVGSGYLMFVILLVIITLLGDLTNGL